MSPKGHRAPAYWRPHAGGCCQRRPTDEHPKALALIEQAYWPFEFDNVSQQPIETASLPLTRERVGSMPDRAEAAAASAALTTLC
jgi:hypothetical protein